MVGERLSLRGRINLAIRASSNDTANLGSIRKIKPGLGHAGELRYWCHLGEVDASCGPVKAVIPAKAGIQWEVRLIRAEQFQARRTCTKP